MDFTGTSESFAVRLREAVRTRGPLCVGIDPHAELLARWGLEDDTNGLREFTRTVIDALADRVAIFKPQVAFFERFGSRGIAVLEDLVHQLRHAGALVLIDAKRGDIGSTSAGYAAAYLHPTSPLAADAITAHPYLGVGSLTPLVEAARAYGAGLFVLAMTSNPEAASVQRARTADGRSIAQLVVDEISQLNEGVGGGSFGVVVGATVGESGLDLSRLNGPILAPGLGAQGARAADLTTVFGPSLPSVLPSYSRAVLTAGPSIEGLQAAVQRLMSECFQVLSGTSGRAGV
jgi:orotidine-5'-phosphate decarboxylase